MDQPSWGRWRGAGALVTTWPLYALLVVGVIGLVLNQLAYQAGPLCFSLAALTTVDPVASLVIGVAVFDERFRNGPGELLGEVLGLALVVAAAIGLTRSAAAVANPPAHGQRRESLSAMGGPAPSDAL